MKTLLPHNGSRAQRARTPIPGTWVMGEVRASYPEGIYILCCLDVRRPRRMHQGHKVEFVFVIVDGPYPTIEAATAAVQALAKVPRSERGPGAQTVSLFCNVTLDGKIWRIGRRSNLFRVISLVLGDHEPPADADPTMLVPGSAFIAEVVTVGRDARKQRLPVDQRYSKVKEVIERVPELDERPDDSPVPF